MTLNWIHSSRNPKAIAFIEYREGYLAEVEYDCEAQWWNIKLFNGMIKYSRDKSVTDIEAIKLIAQQGLQSTILRLGELID